MSKTPDPYANMTDDDFDYILREVLDETPGSHVLSYPGVYEVLKEELNNEVLTRWERRNPSLVQADEDEDEPESAGE